MPTFVDFNIEQSDNAKELRFTETTGIYDGTDNLGGWGTPNEDTTDATAAVIEVTPPGGTLVTIDVFSSFPTNNTVLKEVIDSAALGLTADEELDDGAWLVTYKVTTALTTYTNTQTILISGQARCCVYGMLCAANPCDCNGASLSRALEAYTYYRMTVACALCGNQASFEENLEIVNSYCNGC